MILRFWDGGLIGVSKDQVKSSGTLMDWIENVNDGGERNGDNRMKIM